MPYKIVRSGDGYKVSKRDGSKTFSKHPLSEEKAKAQLRAIYMNSKEGRELLIGGRADGVPNSAFNQKALSEGVIHEKEHVKNLAIANEIAKDHLIEDRKYYKKLKNMETKKPASVAEYLGKTLAAKNASVLDPRTVALGTLGLGVIGAPIGGLLGLIQSRKGHRLRDTLRGAGTGVATGVGVGLGSTLGIEGGYLAGGLHGARIGDLAGSLAGGYGAYNMFKDKSRDEKPNETEKVKKATDGGLGGPGYDSGPYIFSPVAPKLNANKPIANAVAGLGSGFLANQLIGHTALGTIPKALHGTAIAAGPIINKTLENNPGIKNFFQGKTSGGVGKPINAMQQPAPPKPAALAR